MAPAPVQNGHANGSATKLAATAKVFQAIQGHWLSACLGVLMELRIPEILADKRQMTFTEAYPKTTSVHLSPVLHWPWCTYRLLNTTYLLHCQCQHWAPWQRVFT